MVINDVVEEDAANPAEVAVNCGESTLDIGPGLRLVVVHLGVVVVEVGDGNCFEVVSIPCFQIQSDFIITYLASGEPTCTGQCREEQPSASRHR